MDAIYFLVYVLCTGGALRLGVEILRAEKRPKCPTCGGTFSEDPGFFTFIIALAIFSLCFTGAYFLHLVRGLSPTLPTLLIPALIFSTIPILFALSGVNRNLHSWLAPREQLFSVVEVSSFIVFGMKIFRGFYHWIAGILGI